MAKKGSNQERRRVVIVGEGLGVLNGLVAAGVSHEDRDHVASSFFRQTTNRHPSPKPPPPLPSKSAMSVQLNPSSALGFKRPLTSLVKRSLTITNNNAQPVAFKVKTTAPKLYCVRPNSGRVEPGESVDVSVMLQALKEEPPLNTKCKDKFLIQSTLITPEKETLPLADIWAAPDANEEGKVFQQKLRVTYLPAEGQVLEEEEETSHFGQPGNVSVFSANDTSHYDTVRQPPAANGHHNLDSQFIVGASSFDQEDRAPTPSHDAVEQQPSQEPVAAAAIQHHEVPTIVEPVHEPEHRPITPPPAPAPPVVEPPAPEYVPEHHVPEPVPEPTPVSHQHPVAAPAPEPVFITRENPINEELYAKYNKSLAEIDRLRVQVENLEQKVKQAQQAAPATELRRRSRKLSNAGSDTGSDTLTMVEGAPLQPEGVPLNVVVVIAVGVFVTTYLFF